MKERIATFDGFEREGFVLDLAEAMETEVLHVVDLEDVLGLALYSPKAVWLRYRPNTRLGFLVALHELGHHALRHNLRRDSRALREAEAWEWATRLFEPNAREKGWIAYCVMGAAGGDGLKFAVLWDWWDGLYREAELPPEDVIGSSETFVAWVDPAAVPETTAERPALQLSAA